MLLHVSVCDHHQGARTWAELKLQLLRYSVTVRRYILCSSVAAYMLPHHCIVYNDVFYRISYQL